MQFMAYVGQYLTEKNAYQQCIMIPLPPFYVQKTRKEIVVNIKEFDYTMNYCCIIITIETWAPLPPNCAASGWGSRSKQTFHDFLFFIVFHSHYGIEKKTST